MRVKKKKIVGYLRWAQNLWVPSIYQYSIYCRRCGQRRMGYARSSSGQWFPIRQGDLGIYPQECGSCCEEINSESSANLPQLLNTRTLPSPEGIAKGIKREEAKLARELALRDAIRTARRNARSNGRRFI